MTAPLSLDDAIAWLQQGKLIIFPTETVYGLGALANNGLALERIYTAKGRPRHNPLILHCADQAQAAGLTTWCERADRLAQAFWPGPLTLVLPLAEQSDVHPIARAGLPTVAVRVPQHETAQRLLAACEIPLAAPSANRSGRLSSTRLEDLDQTLLTHPDIRLVAETESPCRVGLESTIVDLSHPEGWRILRPGFYDASDIAQVLDTNPLPSLSTDEKAVKAPGQLLKHYAPNTPLRLNAESVAKGEALLAFGPEPLAHSGPTINLSPNGNLEEAAQHLYHALHQLDLTGAACIAVMPVPTTGIGRALNDRLQRAAFRE